MTRNEFIAGVAIALVLGIGCSRGPGRLAAPGISGNASAAAIEIFDADHDGAIGGDELVKVPALKRTLKVVDSNGDGKVTPDEIDARIAAWRKSGIAITRTQAVVRLNGQPLVDADITLVPETFLGDSIQPAKGHTDAGGIASLSIPNPKPGEAGVNLGYYRIEVSKKKPDGSEMIPAKYNTSTELGTEITMDAATAERVTVDLNTK